jgi:hypothetical protein
VSQSGLRVSCARSNPPAPPGLPADTIASKMRYILLLVVVAVGLYLWQNSAKNMATSSDGQAAPVDRARTAAAKGNGDAARAEASQSAVDAGAPAAGVTENMTMDQVRSMMGPPSDTRSETLDNGVVRETWTYSQVNKTVVFENGVAVSVR